MRFIEQLEDRRLMSLSGLVAGADLLGLNDNVDQLVSKATKAAAKVLSLKGASYDGVARFRNSAAPMDMAMEILSQKKNRIFGMLYADDKEIPFKGTIAPNKTLVATFDSQGIAGMIKGKMAGDAMNGMVNLKMLGQVMKGTVALSKAA